uniref:Uncharacterized protein n=1 Tax=Picea glauca TaxID=3330 RepID=A0A101M2N1_PICGL|nr:hypothetical protein ABT39_MTgene3021 [Picea glauca]
MIIPYLVSNPPTSRTIPVATALDLILLGRDETGQPYPSFCLYPSRGSDALIIMKP